MKLMMIGLVLWLMGALVLLGLTVYVFRDLPNVEMISTFIPAETTKIFSYENKILAELHQEENRIVIPIEKISPVLIKTVIALEDTDFYDHHGINIKGILRALYRDVLARSFVEGGSTITQQLARNLFLHRRKKIIRKLAEIILAVQIERKYTKQEILEMYLNQVYWGHNTYGIESASKFYFGKPSIELKLSEATILVGMLKGPELYSPFKDIGRAKKRQRVVLNRMIKLKLVTKKEAQSVYDEEVLLTKRKTFKYKAPFFTSYVVKQLIETYGEEATYTSGMRVYTTLNFELQTKAKEIVNKYIELGKKPYWIKGKKVPNLNFSQGSILAIDPTTGFIKAMQGGVEFKENEFNRCVQAKRQPGSAFKPFVYLAALEKGLSPGTFIDDSPVTFNTIEGPYAPKNYTLKFLGPISMRKALERSVNVVAIKLNDIVDPKTVVRVAKELGIKAMLEPILSLPLGAKEVTMLDLVSSYGVIANQGRRIEPVSILRVEDRDGTPLFEHRIQEKRVYDANIIATLVEMMRGVVKFGTGRNARLPRPVAGKTGTTSDYKDAWFVGFVPQLVCGTWVGNDDNTPMNNMTGGWMPAMMWKEFMKEALKNIPAQDFPSARNIVKRKVDLDTGLLADQFTSPDRISVEKFWKGSKPMLLGRYQDKSGKTSQEILDFFEL